MLDLIPALVGLLGNLEVYEIVLGILHNFTFNIGPAKKKVWMHMCRWEGKLWCPLNNRVFSHDRCWSVAASSG